MSGKVYNNSTFYKNQIRELQNKIKTYLKQNQKKDKKLEKENSLIIKRTNLLIQANDKLRHLNARSKQALIKSIHKANNKKLDNIQLVLNNLDKIEGDFRISKLKSHLEQINNNQVKKVNVKSAFNGTALDARIEKESKSVEGFFEAVKPEIKKVINDRLSKHNIKTHFTFVCEMGKKEVGFIDDDEEENIMDIKDFPIRSKSHIFLNTFEANQTINRLAEYFINQIEIIKNNSSGWVFIKTKYIDIETTKYRPLKGGSYIELPQWISSKKACINIKNDDEECFKWAVLSSLFFNEINSKKSNEVNQYKKFVDRLKWDCIEFPSKLKDIVQFEKINPQYCINLFIVNGEICPYRINRDNKNKTIINLLLIENDEGKSHYVSIRNISRLINTDGNNKKHICLNCLQCFWNEDNLINHKSYCDKNECSKIVMPSDTPYKTRTGRIKPRNDFIQFKNYDKMLKVPFVFYADFESYLESIECVVNSPDKSSTDIFQEHKPASFCLYRVCIDNKYNKIYKYDLNSNDIVVDFLNVLKESTNEATEIMRNVVPMNLTEEEEKHFQTTSICHICNKEATFNSDNYKVRDHCHITGKYRGVAHNNCNLQYRYTYKFPCIFHNLKGYDSHHIINSISKIIDDSSELGCIPTNKEKYLTFNWDNIHFIDSIQFMASSLEELAKNLNYDDKVNTRDYFKKFGDNATKLIIEKGIFPYDWFSGKDKMACNKLPSMNNFYSKLTETNITKEEYERAINVWNTFKCKTFQDYHDLYLITDVLLLSDVFENFRNVCINNYGLDPAHYLSAPGLAWDASLKMTNVKLELLTDYDMHLFIEKGMRGGNSMIAHRHAIANNKYMLKYDKNKKSSYIIYLDANNLYGWAMCQKLPYGNFKWIDDISNLQTNEDILKLNAHGDKGYILEVDLEYPEALHDLHNNYPLAPEKMVVNDEMLSPFSLSMKDKLNISKDETPKLITTLSDKNNYVLHIKNLHLYISLGLKIKKVHKVLSFSQKAWLKPYIDFNTKQRANAKNDFEKDFYKLMNNSVFGKTMENVRNRIDFRLVCNEDKLVKLASKIQFQGRILFGNDDEYIAGVSMAKSIIKLDKPIYVGMTILDLSKTLMYNFHYNIIMKQYNNDYNKVKLLFTDTDSLCYHIETNDIYKDMKEYYHEYDFSDYPKEHFLFSNDNKKVIGKFKCETSGVPITEFVGLRSKMYSFTYCKNNKTIEKKTCKGVKKYVIKKDIHFDNYKDALFTEGKEVQFATMNCIRSKKHKLMSVRINKVGLSMFDTKRFICENNINTYAFGHYKTKKI